MLLALDIGNTNITLGVFESNNLLEVKRIPTDTNCSVKEYAKLLTDTLENRNINGCIISSVVNGLDTVLLDAVKSVFCVESLVVTNKLKSNLIIKTDIPEELGADRFVNDIAAIKSYKLPVIVIDIGTAITFDVINNKKELIGGLIAPGINMQLKSLSDGTSKLPNLSIENFPRAVSTNTIDEIMSGVIRGTACMIDGMIEQTEKELGESATTVITGGQSNIVNKYMTHKVDYINPTLTLEGLLELYELNSHH